MCAAVAFYEQLYQRLSVLPGSTAAALTSRSRTRAQLRLADAGASLACLSACHRKWARCEL